MHDVYDGTHETVTIKEASERLGISEQAVRQRIRRKTLPAQRLDGKLYVVLSAGYNESPPSPTPGQDSEHVRVASAVRDAYTELVAQLQSENEHLRQQLSVKDDQLRANQILMSQLTHQLHALPAAIVAEQEHAKQAPESPVPAPSRPWWRFWESR